MLNPIKDDLRYKNISINWTIWEIVIQDESIKEIKGISSIPLVKSDEENPIQSVFYTPTKILWSLQFFEYSENNFKTNEALTTEVWSLDALENDKTPWTYFVNYSLWKIYAYSLKDVTMAYSYNFSNKSIIELLKSTNDVVKTISYLDAWTADERILTIVYSSDSLSLDWQELFEYEGTAWNYRISKISSIEL